MIAFLALLLLTAILAYFEAKREDGMIDARPGGPDLNHDELVWRRLRNVGALVMVAVVCDGTEGWYALWMGLCHAAGAWGVFTIVHRLSLNLMRGKTWNYTSRGNKYDSAFIGIAGDIHRAGTLEYCFEATVLAASITCAILILTNH